LELNHLLESVIGMSGARFFAGAAGDAVAIAVAGSVAATALVGATVALLIVGIVVATATVAGAGVVAGSVEAGSVGAESETTTVVGVLKALAIVPGGGSTGVLVADPAPHPASTVSVASERKNVSVMRERPAMHLPFPKPVAHDAIMPRLPAPRHA